jgi:hypothetical protein
MTGCTGDAMDILEQFKVKHNIVCSDLGNFSFSSKSFKQENPSKRNSKLTPSPAAKVEDQTAANVSFTLCPRLIEISTALHWTD